MKREARAEMRKIWFLLKVEPPFSPVESSSFNHYTLGKNSFEKNSAKEKFTKHGKPSLYSTGQNHQYGQVVSFFSGEDEC